MKKVVDEWVGKGEDHSTVSKVERSTLVDMLTMWVYENFGLESDK